MRTFRCGRCKVDLPRGRRGYCKACDLDYSRERRRRIAAGEPSGREWVRNAHDATIAEPQRCCWHAALADWCTSPATWRGKGSSMWSACDEHRTRTDVPIIRLSVAASGQATSGGSGIHASA